LRILVADDEPIEREALRVLVQRYLPDVQVVGEAGSGTEAIELAEAHRPDVIFMDIEMPGLSGLEALHEIRERCPGTRCIIVSAFDYFHFAREALRLGAVDYLLKPVGREQMLDILGRLGREISAERQKRQDALQHKEQMSHLRPLAEAELAGMLMRGEADGRRETLLQFMGVRFEAGLAMVLGLTGASIGPEVAPADRDLKAREAYQYLRSLAHSLCTCVVTNYAEDRVGILVELNPPVDEYHTRTWSSDLGRRLRDRVKDQTGVRFRVGIGEPFCTFSDVPRSCQEALAAFRFKDLSDKVTHFGDLGDQAVPTSDGLHPQLSSHWRPTPAVLRAVEVGTQHIREHFGDDLSLERVAREVSLTPYYYSKVFSRVTGETLVDYLTRVRVAEAKRLLLNPAVSIKEACFSVGYNDPNYFSRVFKKVTGLTPTEFRTGNG